MSIKIKYYDNEVFTIFIDDVELENDGENFITPKYLLKDKNVNDIPVNTVFDICLEHTDGIIQLDAVPYSFTRIGNNKLLVRYSDTGRRKYWDGNYGFKIYMETKRDIVKEREKEIGDIKFISYEDDGEYIFLDYSIEIESELFNNVIDTSDQIISEIEGAVTITLGSPFKDIEDTANEKEFTVSLIIPLLRKLGFVNVRYNHGKKEFGKEIIFVRKTEFDEYEYWGAQVKYGDISGEANSEVDTIIAQIDDSMKIPFYDVYTRKKEKLSKVAIIISGKFTENAVEKICEKIESNSIKNNLVFIDSDKINSLMEKFSKLA